VSREKGKEVRRKAGLGGKGDAARVRAKMGRREAAEKGVWRLRADEARYGALGLSPLNLLLSFHFPFLFYFRWDAFVPLHRLWLGYMSELLGLGVAPPPPEEGGGPASAPALPQPAGTIQAKLVKADFHGSIMTGQSFSLLMFFLAGEIQSEIRLVFNLCVWMMATATMAMMT